MENLILPIDSTECKKRMQLTLQSHWALTFHQHQPIPASLCLIAVQQIRSGPHLVQVIPSVVYVSARYIHSAAFQSKLNTNSLRVLPLCAALTFNFTKRFLSTFLMFKALMGIMYHLLHVLARLFWILDHFWSHPRVQRDGRGCSAGAIRWVLARFTNKSAGYRQSKARAYVCECVVVR